MVSIVAFVNDVSGDADADGNDDNGNGDNGNGDDVDDNDVDNNDAVDADVYVDKRVTFRKSKFRANLKKFIAYVGVHNFNFAKKQRNCDNY